MPAPKPPQWMFTRKQSAALFGWKSIDPILRLEKEGKLKKRRPTGPRGQVMHTYEELVALMNEEATDARR